MHKILLCVAAILTLSACSDNDPFMESPETAKAKTQQCLDDLHAAIASRNEEKVNTLTNDPECAQASRAHAKHVNRSLIDPVIVPESDPRKLAENTQPATKVDSHHGTKIDAEAIATAKAAQEAKWAEELKQMEFRDYYQLSKKCLTSMIERKTAKCAVVRSLMNERYQAEVDAISAQYQGNALEAYSKKICTGENRDDAKCEIALRASEKIK